jgi:hypothetical protein
MVDTLPVAKGDTIDFITDCNADANADSFGWGVELTLARDGQTLGSWRSADGFHGPLAAGAPLQPGHVVRAWQAAYLRTPTADELTSAVAFLQAQLGYLQGHPESLTANTTPERQALTNLCQALLSSNEFLYVD